MSATALRLPNLPLDAASTTFAEEITAQPGVRSVLVLPDGFTKAKYLTAKNKVTVPSSSVIVSDVDSLYPQFRSRGIGCGMAAVALPLQAEEVTDELKRLLWRKLTYSPYYYAAYRMRWPLFPGPVDLSRDEFAALVKESGADQTLLNQKWFNRRTARLRHSFGRYFGGNHFFELQVAQEAVPELSLRANQVVAMYHTGCQGLEALIPTELRQQYLHQPTYVRTAPVEPMYQAFFAAHAVLQHYTTSYREATKALIDRALEQAGLPASTMLVNQGHNSVSEEDVEGRRSLVYRHNAVPLTPNEWTMVSGMYNHDSYLVCGGPNTFVTQNTLDHGLGYVLEQDEDQQKVEQATVTLERFHHGLTAKRTTTSTPLQQSQNAAAYFELLLGKQIISRTVSLRPFVSMKYTR